MGSGNASFPLWAQWLQVTATLLVLIGGSFIAYRQWTTAQSKLMLDLFDKRFSLFRVLMSFEINERGPSDITIAEAKATALQMGFLFGDEVVRHVNATLGAIRTQNGSELARLKKSSGDIFLPYMDFRKTLPGADRSFALTAWALREQSGRLTGGRQAP